MASETVDFFISYTGVDENWAQWIAWQLTTAGYSVVIQCWDFGAGSNFVQEMHDATANARQTIAVLSPAFLNSRFTSPEWQAAFAKDPLGTDRRLIPVRIAECGPSGLLAQIVYIDLVGLTESAASEKLKFEIEGRRPPDRPPSFPGSLEPHVASSARPRFPSETDQVGGFCSGLKLKLDLTRSEYAEKRPDVIAAISAAMDVSVDLVLEISIKSGSVIVEFSFPVVRACDQATLRLNVDEAFGAAVVVEVDFIKADEKTALSGTTNEEDKAMCSAGTELNPMTGHPRSASSGHVVVYFRLDDLKKLGTGGRIAYAVETLRKILQDATVGIENAEVHSSVYGRFALFQSPEDSIAVATEVLTKTAEVGISVRIGMDYGRVTTTRDVHAWNVSGDPINRAARLAFLRTKTPWRIAVTPDVYSFLKGHGKKFGSQTNGKVKRTILPYRWLHHSVEFGEVTSEFADRSAIAHVVVYDLAGYSEASSTQQVISVETLGTLVREALDTSGGVKLLHESRDRWYAPAGDGGVLVFREHGGEVAAWQFAQRLQQLCTGNNVKVRIGIATGSVVILHDDYPVGPAILDADELSGLPDTAGVGCNSTYWNQLKELDRVGWQVKPAPKRPKEWFLLFDSDAAEETVATETQVDVQPLSDDELEACMRAALGRINGDDAKSKLGAKLVPGSSTTDWVAVTDAIMSRLVSALAKAAAGATNQAEVQLGPIRSVISELKKESSPDLRAVIELEDRFMQAMTQSTDLGEISQKLKDGAVLSGVFAGTCDSAVTMGRVLRYQPRYRMIPVGEGKHRPAEISVASASLRPLSGTSPEEIVFNILQDTGPFVEVDFEAEQWGEGRQGTQEFGEFTLPCQLFDLIEKMRGLVISKSGEIGQVLFSIVRLPESAVVRNKVIELLEAIGEQSNIWDKDAKQLLGMIFVELKADNPASANRRDVVFMQSIRRRFAA